MSGSGGVSVGVGVSMSVESPQHDMITVANRCREIACRDPVNIDLSSALDKYLNVVKKLTTPSPMSVKNEYRGMGSNPGESRGTGSNPVESRGMGGLNLDTSRNESRGMGGIQGNVERSPKGNGD